MFRAGDDFTLHAGAQFHEVGAVAGHADDEVLVVFGMFPGLEQHFLVVDADLHVPELEVHEVADEVHEVGGALFAADHLRIELQVEQAGTRGWCCWRWTSWCTADR